MNAIQLTAANYFLETKHLYWQKQLSVVSATQVSFGDLQVVLGPAF